MFGIQKMSAYGSLGEFTIGAGASAIRARYILTKIKPGNDGSWECELASQMKPWREVFNVEELSFDELLQRDLDDSRVAHDLIPYLLGQSGIRAKFFPPILAVIVPRRQGEAGIEGFYPQPDIRDSSNEEYGELFDIKQFELDESPIPLVSLNYNRQRSAFIIVDGQHRAMAVLALHRQLNRSWENNAFASYYDHIFVTSEQVNNIELPTCIIYFPDLFEGNSAIQQQGFNLISACREVFLVVNRSAKRVSESRELLLDDEDIAARLMRRTLSAIKDRREDPTQSARIYSISYGDSDTEDGQKEVISGHLEYSSAIAIHKIHRAISFGINEAYRLNRYVDVSDGRRTKNKDRAPEILLGTEVEHLSTVARFAGTSLPPDQIRELVDKLGDLTDKTLLTLFDIFRPFRVHNHELWNLKRRLSDPQARSQIEQKKAYTLIFEGSGVRNVFESHFTRLEKVREERASEEESGLDSLQDQIEFCESVERALDYHERIFQQRRACRFFSVDYERFYETPNGDKTDQRKLEEKARKLFQTLSTQAFQLGYTMAIFTVVEELKSEQPNSAFLQYQERFELVQFVTDAYLVALNTYFSPKESINHHTLTGYIDEPRASVFDSDSLGLRGLLKMSVEELNERQWRFFRYAILEIVHSNYCWPSAQEKMQQSENMWALQWYKDTIPRLVKEIVAERDHYISNAIEAALKNREFRLDIMQQEAQARGEGKSDEEIKQLVSELHNTCEKEAKQKAENHLKASLKNVEGKEAMKKRLNNWP